MAGSITVLQTAPLMLTSTGRTNAPLASAAQVPHRLDLILMQNALRDIRIVSPMGRMAVRPMSWELTARTVVTAGLVSLSGKSTDSTDCADNAAKHWRAECVAGQCSQRTYVIGASHKTRMHAWMGQL